MQFVVFDNKPLLVPFYPHEIESIIEEMRRIYYPLNSEFVCDNFENFIREEISSLRIYEDVKPELKKQILRRFNDSLVTPGTSIGTESALSIGQDMTQARLSAFHLSGYETGTQDSNLFELFDVSKKSNRLYIFLLDQYETLKHCIIVGELVLERTLESICSKIEKTHYQDSTRPSFCLKFNDVLLAVAMKTIRKIAKEIKEKHKKLEVRIHKKKIIISQKKPESEENLTSVLQMVACGIEGVYKYNVVQYEKGKYRLDVEGCFAEKAFKESYQKLCYKTPFINPYKCASNNLHIIKENLGIEAVRESIVSEVEHAQKGLNYKHATLVADTMCFTGVPLPFTRHGSLKSSSVLSDAAFETPFQTFVAAAFNQDRDNLTRPNSQIMVGRKVTTGPNFFGLYEEKDNGEVVPAREPEFDEWEL